MNNMAHIKVWYARRHLMWALRRNLQGLTQRWRGHHPCARCPFEVRFTRRYVAIFCLALGFIAGAVAVFEIFRSIP